MKPIICILTLLSFTILLKAQPGWQYYSTDGWVSDLKVSDENVFIGNPTGFHVIDIETKETKFYQSVNSPLKGSFVWELLEKEDHVWLALNEGGLARYEKTENALNGNWEQYYTPINGDLDTINYARNLIETEDGTLWFDSQWYEKAFLSSIKDGVVTDHSDLFPSKPFAMSCHGTERMYFKFSSNDLYYVDLALEEIVPIVLPEGGMLLHSYTAYDDVLYASLSNNLGNYLYAYDDNWQKIADTEELIYFGNVVKGKTHIWINAVNEIPDFIKINSESYEEYTVEELFGNQITPGGRIEILYEDAKGRLWITNSREDSKETFVYSIKDDNVESYNISHSALKSSVYDNNLKFDCSGNLIIPNLTWAQIFNPDSLIIADLLENRNAGDLSVVASDPTTCLTYIGHDGRNSDPSFIYVLDGNIVVDTLFLDNGYLLDMIVTTEGQLILASFDGIGLYDKETKEWNWNKEPLFNPLLGTYSNVRSIKEQKNGAITFGTSTSLVVLDQGVYTIYNNTNSPIDGSVNNHIIDSKGDILITYDGGIYTYNGTEWDFTTFYDPYDDFISSIYEDDLGNYWLGSWNSGLLYWNGATSIEYTVANSAIPSDHILQILEHPITNDLWLTTTRGIAIFNRDRFTYKKGVFGKTFYDAEKDAVYNPGDDVGISDVFIQLNDAVSVLTDLNGNYAYYPNNNGALEIECITPSEFEPTNVSLIDLEFDNQDVFDNNFGLWRELEPADIKVDIAASPFICSSEISIWMTLENPGWTTIDGTARLTLPDDIQIIETYPVADDIMDNTITWNFEDLSFLEQRSLSIVIEGPSVEDIILEFGEVDSISLDLSAVIAYDGITIDTTESVPFLCAYDPNDKLAISEGPSLDNYSLLNDDLIYTIRFQNEGNYKATHVVITDAISNQLDIQTLEIISNSHHMQTKINKGNEVVFTFMNIDLPPKSENEGASQGFVKFKVSPSENLPNHSGIYNTAYIYFDNNAPIQTNYTENILVESLDVISANEETQEDMQITVFPNPSNHSFELRSHFLKFNYSVHDVTGKEILKNTSSTGSSKFRIITPGIYFVVVNNEQSNYVLKVIRN